MLIKNVLPHSDNLHDGRPIASYDTADITAEELQLEHYQSRLRDGLMVLVEEQAAEPSGGEGDAAVTTVLLDGEPIATTEPPAGFPDEDSEPASEQPEDKDAEPKPKPKTTRPRAAKRTPKGASKETT